MSTASEQGLSASRILILELVPGLNEGYGLSRIQFLESSSLGLAKTVMGKERRCWCRCGDGEHLLQGLVMVGVETAVGFCFGG